MNKTAINIFELLIHAPATATELAPKLGLTISAISQTIPSLDAKGLIKKERVKKNIIIKPSDSLLSRELIKIKNRFSLESLLGDSNEFVLAELGEEKTFDELLEKTNLSVVQLYRILTDLQEIGALKKEDKKFVAVEELHFLITLLRKIHERIDIEVGSIVMHSDNYKLKKAPSEFPLKGTPTAFSAFSKYNIEYITPYQYAISPEKELSLEEVFVHSIKCSENKKDMLMCIIFYLKNKRRIDIHISKKIAEKFDVLDQLMDILAFIDQRKVKNESLFLAWVEFKEKAAVYGIKAKDKYKLNTLEELLNLLGKSLKEPITVYLIGGCNLAIRGIKASTKDIDLIVKDQKTYNLFTKSLKEIGFKEVTSFSKAYVDMNPSAIFEKPGYPRIDVFTEIVCDSLKLNKQMIDRTHDLEYGTLKIGLISLEDIILFKSITEREGDLEDAADIIRREKIDWDLVFNELLLQEKNTKKTFCFYVLDNLELLKERYGMKIRILGKLSKHCLEQGLTIALEKPRDVKELKNLINFSETTIRNALASLLRKNKIKKIIGKPVKFVNT